MGAASKAASVILRASELICAAIVLGIISYFIRNVHQGNGDVNGKIIYTEVWAAISIAFSIALILPFMYSFYAFPLDLIMFVGWMVAFGLDYNLTGSHVCSSFWYWNYWGYYWGRFWYIPRNTITRTVVGSAGCSNWRVQLAFAFIGGFCWLGNMLVGVYVVARKRDERNRNPPPTTQQKHHWWKKEKLEHTGSVGSASVASNPENLNA